jgi:hypothetical protein
MLTSKRDLIATRIRAIISDLNACQKQAKTTASLPGSTVQSASAKGRARRTAGQDRLALNMIGSATVLANKIIQGS